VTNTQHQLCNKLHPRSTLIHTFGGAPPSSLWSVSALRLPPSLLASQHNHILQGRHSVTHIFSPSNTCCYTCSYLDSSLPTPPVSPPNGSSTFSRLTSNCRPTLPYASPNQLITITSQPIPTRYRYIQWLGKSTVSNHHNSFLPSIQALIHQCITFNQAFIHRTYLSSNPCEHVFSQALVFASAISVTSIHQ